MSRGSQLSCCLHLPQNCADPVAANTGTGALEVADAETPLLPSDRLADELGLGTERLDGFADTLLELRVGLLQNPQRVVDERPRVVCSLVPALRALLECFVVAILVLLDEPFQA